MNQHKIIPKGVNLKIWQATVWFPNISLLVLTVQSDVDLLSQSEQSEVFNFEEFSTGLQVIVHTVGCCETQAGTPCVLTNLGLVGQTKCVRKKIRNKNPLFSGKGEEEQAQCFSLINDFMACEVHRSRTQLWDQSCWALALVGQGCWAQASEGSRTAESRPQQEPSKVSQASWWVFLNKERTHAQVLDWRQIPINISFWANVEAQPHFFP